MEVTPTSYPEESVASHDEEHLFVLPEVCEQLRISIHTGRKLVRSKRLRCYENGGIRRFTREHIQEFLCGN